MYRFVDRPLEALAVRDAFLLRAARMWVGATSGRRCPAARLANAFAGAGVADALPDFSMAMAVLNCDGLARLQFGAPCFPQATDDEARLLALFDAAQGDEVRSRRMAAAFVRAEAVDHLVVATQRVLIQLAGAVFPHSSITDAEF